MKKLGIIASVVIIFTLIGFKLASNKKIINEQNKPVDRSMVAIPVTIDKASEMNVGGVFTLPAVLKPVNEANITLNTSGKIKVLNFDLGTRVNKGEIIGSVDNNLKQINLASAQLLAQKNETDYNRLKELYEGKAASEVDYTNAKYAYENAKNQVEQIKQQIADGNLISPVNGVITKKNIEEGEFVSTGAVIATVVDVSSLKATVMVSERDVYRLKQGMPVTIFSDVFPGREFKGNIRFISDAGDESHNYEVEVTIQNDNRVPIKAGTFVTVTFDLKGDSKVLQISKLALVEGTKNPYVYIANGNKPVIRKLILGRDLGDNIEILGGLQPGEAVITSGQINLTENSIIEVITSK
ncbi:MAG TPA: efflux RND transporter periplasmic adaptor subunit [Bacteroidia bacterium]|nr:efflux RND transporter periplasmic adaptor subunit [Bacteroidia bacterium]